MKREELAAIQPQLLKTFERILGGGRIHHAYLFSGEFASFEMAIFISQALFCTNKEGVLPCGHCRACQLIAQDEFSDVTVVQPVNGIIKTDRVRELVKSFSQSGVEGSKQVFIIRQADRMHVNAANSLLKVIEEPSSEIYVFFLTAEQEMILPTIKSRTQIFQFPKNESYLEHMLEENGLLKDQARIVARYARSLEEAKTLSQEKFFFDLADEARRFVSDLSQRPNRAFLRASLLTSKADDKEKQEMVWRLLEQLLAEQVSSKQGRALLLGLHQARQMNRSNVPFQACLEFATYKI